MPSPEGFLVTLMPSQHTDRRLAKLVANSEPERPYPRYENTSQRFWRDLKLQRKFPGAR